MKNSNYGRQQLTVPKKNQVKKHQKVQGADWEVAGLNIEAVENATGKPVVNDPQTDALAPFKEQQVWSLREDAYFLAVVGDYNNEEHCELELYFKDFDVCDKFAARITQRPNGRIEISHYVVAQQSEAGSKHKMHSANKPLSYFLEYLRRGCFMENPIKEQPQLIFWSEKEQIRFGISPPEETPAKENVAGIDLNKVIDL